MLRLLYKSGCGEALDRAMVTRLLCGISTRKYSRTTTAEAGEAACVSKSEASRRFVKQIDKMMDEFFVRPIDDRGGQSIFQANFKKMDD